MKITFSFLLFADNPHDFLEQFFNLPLFFESYLNTVLSSIQAVE